MNSPAAYLNGQFISAAELSVPISDLGFIHGVTISEQTRTFGGKIFQLERHLDRFWHGLELIKVESAFDRSALERDLRELALRNYNLVPSGGDLGLCFFATPGRYTAFDPTAFPHSSRQPAAPTLAAHAYPLPFDRWAAAYEHGIALVRSSFQEVPAECWPKTIKCRSRMHYFLADLEAQSIQNGAKPILTDAAGRVRDSSIASLIFYDANRGLITPQHDHTFSSISVAVVREFAEALSIPFLETEIAYADIHACSELMLASTPWCLIPACSIDGKTVSACPGPIFQRLIEHWSQVVGLSIVKQARQTAALSG